MTYTSLFFLLLNPVSGWAAYLWIQQQNLKSLDGKTDVHTIYRAMMDAGENLRDVPQGVQVFGANFRELVLSIPDNYVSQPELLENLKNRYLRTVADALKSIELPPQEKSWLSWLEKGTRMGASLEVENAFIQMKLNDFGLTFEEWKAKTQLLRKYLLDLAQGNQTPWIEVLGATRKYGRDEAAMERWAKENRLPTSAGKSLQEYGRLLTLADFLDPRRGSHQKPLSTFLEEARSHKRFLMADITGLGVTNRIAQDRWFAKGAKLSELKNVVLLGDRKLEAVASLIRRILENNIGYVPRNSYLMGDLIAFSFPHAIAPGVEEKILNEVRATGWLHIKFGRVDKDSPQQTFVSLERYLKTPPCRRLLTAP